MQSFSPHGPAASEQAESPGRAAGFGSGGQASKSCVGELELLAAGCRLDEIGKDENPIRKLILVVDGAGMEEGLRVVPQAQFENREPALDRGDGLTEAPSRDVRVHSSSCGPSLCDASP